MIIAFTVSPTRCKVTIISLNRGLFVYVIAKQAPAGICFIRKPTNQTDGGPNHQFVYNFPPSLTNEVRICERRSILMQLDTQYPWVVLTIYIYIWRYYTIFVFIVDY